MSGEPSLSATEITVQFGGLKVLDDFDLAVPLGQVTGLIGPNGAGKTTVLNVLTGFLKPNSGDVRVNGQSLLGKKPHKIRRLGIARTFQSGRLGTNLTVLETIAVAGIGLGLKRRHAEAKAEDILDWLNIAHLALSQTGGLPYTDQRRVAIGRAVMGRPSFLLLDEPAAGMAERETEDLEQLVANIAKKMGTGVLLVEHNLRMVLNICGDVNLLNSGKIIASGSPDEIQTSEIVKEAYIGSSLTNNAIEAES